MRPGAFKAKLSSLNRRPATTNRNRVSYDTKNGRSVKWSWFELSNLTKERAQGMCQSPGCNKPGKEAHHIIPLSKGGLNGLSNLMWICETCHDRRHNHMANRSTTGTVRTKRKIR